MEAPWSCRGRTLLAGQVRRRAVDGLLVVEDTALAQQWVMSRVRSAPVRDQSLAEGLDPLPDLGQGVVGGDRPRRRGAGHPLHRRSGRSASARPGVRPSAPGEQRAGAVQLAEAAGDGHLLAAPECRTTPTYSSKRLNRSSYGTPMARYSVER